MRHLLTLTALLVPTLAAADPCPSTSKDLKSAFERGIAAFDSMDLEQFERTRDEARIALTCLSGVVAPKDAAAYHRLEALDGFAAGSEERTFAAFRRAHEIDPEYDLPPGIAPAGHPLRVQFDRARNAEPSPQDALKLEADTWIDGKATALRPRELPAVLQVRREGEITYSGYLMPGYGVPSTAAQKRKARTARAPRNDSLKDLKEPRQAHGAGVDFSGLPTRRIAYGAAGTAALVTGLVFLGSSLGTRAEFRDTATPYDDVLPLKGKANRQFFGFEVLTVTAIGLGTVAVLPDASTPSWVP